MDPSVQAPGRRRPQALLRTALVAALVMAAPAVAQAQASVQVQVLDAAGRPVDGTVTLTGSGGTRTCRTTASRCSMTVPAGTWSLRLAPVRGGAPPPRSIRVPASGVVRLAVRATATPVTATASPSGLVVHPGATAHPATRATPAGVVVRPGSTARRTTTPAASRAAAPGVTVRPAPTVRPGTHATTVTPGTSSTATHGGSGPVVVPAPGVATARPAAQQAPVTTGRNLASGSTLRVQGTVLDAAGRPTDATITFSQAGRVVGTVRTTAGRFSAYDLPTGSYALAIASARGTSARASLTVGSGVSRVTLRVP